MARLLIVAFVAAGAVFFAAATTLLADDSASADHAGDTPTCSTTLGIDHHGVHVINDYVIGADGTGPGAGEGAEIPGGPGPGFHFPNGIAPGASFCLIESQAPGVHLGP